MVVLNSWLPAGGENLFQNIKMVRTQAEERGIKILNLSIGQPQGPALLSAREAAATAVLSDKESMHEYQDNGSPGVPDFAKRFVKTFVGPIVDQVPDLGFLPVPGIKPMLGLIPLACGLRGIDGLSVITTTNPGYPTPADWCSYLGFQKKQPQLSPENQFRFSVQDFHRDTKLVMMNFPHNPSGQIATKEWLHEICKYCAEKGIRIFNDAAYFGLSYDHDSSCLTQVAHEFPNLSWAEAFSASKMIGNGTGWRVGAVVGSADFVDDIAKIKGNTDSGFAAPMAAGSLYALENDREGVHGVYETYKRRLHAIIDILSGCGMELAVFPGAGFFTLWKVPKRAFGQDIMDAKEFNYLMIENTGVVGVHFNPHYIRYAVTSDIVAMSEEIRASFKKAHVQY